MHEFVDDDAAYSGWIAEHPQGFVLNTRRVPSQSYAVLHRADCKAISRPRDDGAYTGRGYRKVAADTVDELRRYIRSVGGTGGSFSGACGHCNPLGS